MNEIVKVRFDVLCENCFHRERQFETGRILNEYCLHVGAYLEKVSPQTCPLLEREEDEERNGE